MINSLQETHLTDKNKHYQKAENMAKDLPS
jgi:hypothetical protein